MKKNLFFCLFAVLCTAGLFTSCSDDDEATPPVVIPVEQEIAGNYKGQLDVTMIADGENIPVGTVASQLVLVSKAGELAVTLAIKDFSFSGFALGDIELSNCQLIPSGNAYTFTATSSLNASGLAAAINAKGSFSGGKLLLDLDINEVKVSGNPVNYTVKVTYDGTKQNGALSSEARITAFTFSTDDSENNAVVTGEGVIDDEAKTVVFTVSGEASEEQLKALVPTIAVSGGATVSPASKVAQDFSGSEPVAYTVTAEDGTECTYQVSAKKETVSAEVSYDFETWVDETHKPTAGSAKTFSVPEGWKTSNAGIVEMGLMSFIVGNPEMSVLKEAGEQEGSYAAMVQTQNTKGGALLGFTIPTITAGSLYLGEWKTNAKNTLNSTKFGIAFSNAQGKPVSVKVRYKYESGKDYYTCADGAVNKGTVDASRGEYADKFSVKVSLYTTEGYDEDEFSDYLTGEAGEMNFYTSSRVVGKGALEGGPTNGEWKDGTIELGDYTFEADQTYRFAIVCSSSYEGDKFYGAPGSKLWIDSIEVVYEK